MSKLKIMKKHRAIPNDTLIDYICEEFNDCRDIKILSFNTMLYIEYYLNEFIKIIFSKPRLIIDDSVLGGFNNKIKILTAFGYFKSRSDLLYNIDLIRQIRNHYAHHLQLSNKTTMKVKTIIKKMVYLNSKGIKDTYDDGPWEEHEDPSLAQFIICSLAVISSLQNMYLKS